MGEEPEAQEVKAIAKMGIGKAGGHDEVVAEYLKHGGEECQAEVVKIVKKMWRRATYAEEGDEAGGWPKEWTIAVQMPLWKNKGDKADKNTWRGVTLLSAFSSRRLVIMALSLSLSLSLSLL